MVAIGVTVTRKGKPLRRQRVAMSSKHLRRMGQLIVASIRANILAGVDPNGSALPPDVSGDGRPLIESGALLASIKVARARGGSLTVSPDYKKTRYAIFLENGFDTRAADERIAAGAQKKRKRELKRHGHGVPRRFLGIGDATLQVVLGENKREVEKWLGGLLGSGEQGATEGLMPTGATEGVLPVGVA